MDHTLQRDTHQEYPLQLVLDVPHPREGSYALDHLDEDAAHSPGTQRRDGLEREEEAERGRTGREEEEERRKRRRRGGREVRGGEEEEE